MKYYASYLHFLVWLLALSLASAHGDVLSIDSTNKVIDIDCHHSSALVLYKIKNNSQSKVVIQSVIPDCGCTLVQSFDHTILPGKICLLSLNFDASRFTGNVKKHILIAVQGKEKPLLVSFTARIHRPVEAFPRTLVWYLNALPLEKTCIIKVCHDQNVLSTKCETTNDYFNYQIEKIDRFTYKLHLIPRNIQAEGIEIVDFQVISSNGTVEAITCYAIIQDQGKPFSVSL